MTRRLALVAVTAVGVSLALVERVLRQLDPEFG